MNIVYMFYFPSYEGRASKPSASS